MADINMTFSYDDSQDPKFLLSSESSAWDWEKGEIDVSGAEGQKTIKFDLGYCIIGGVAAGGFSIIGIKIARQEEDLDDAKVCANGLYQDTPFTIAMNNDGSLTLTDDVSKSADRRITYFFALGMKLWDGNKVWDDPRIYNTGGN